MQVLVFLKLFQVQLHNSNKLIITTMLNPRPLKGVYCNPPQWFFLTMFFRQPKIAKGLTVIYTNPIMVYFHKHYSKFGGAVLVRIVVKVVGRRGSHVSAIFFFRQLFFCILLTCLKIWGRAHIMSHVDGWYLFWKERVKTERPLLMAIHLRQI